MRKTFHTATLAGLLALAGFAGTAAADDLKVVASFSIIADLARNVGGDRVTIRTLVPVDGDAHTYEPRPADAVALGEAQVVLVNGLGLEGFLTRLVEASGTKAAIVEVSHGVVPLKAEAEGHESHDGNHDGDHDGKAGHDHGAFDPHAWQSVPNAELYVAAIAEAFCKADGAGCGVYTQNAKAYSEKLAALQADVTAAIAAIPRDKRTIITSHDAFGYFAQAYGLTFLAPEGMSTEAEASAADVVHLVDQVRHDKASAIFVENITNPRLIEQIAAETGLKVGGTLYSDALSGPDGPASTYLDMVRHNVETLKAAILAS